MGEYGKDKTCTYEAMTESRCSGEVEGDKERAKMGMVSLCFRVCTRMENHKNFVRIECVPSNPEVYVQIGPSTRGSKALTRA